MANDIRRILINRNAKIFLNISTPSFLDIKSVEKDITIFRKIL